MFGIIPWWGLWLVVLLVVVVVACLFDDKYLEPRRITAHLRREGYSDDEIKRLVR